MNPNKTVLPLKAQYMGTMGGRALIFPPISPSIGCFAFSLCLLLAVQERVGGRRNVSWHGGVLLLSWWLLLSHLRALIHHHPYSWGSDIILYRTPFCSTNTTQNNGPQEAIYPRKSVSWQLSTTLTFTRNVPVSLQLFERRLFFYVCPLALKCLFCTL